MSSGGTGPAAGHQGPAGTPAARGRGRTDPLRPALLFRAIAVLLTAVFAVRFATDLRSDASAAAVGVDGILCGIAAGATLWLLTSRVWIERGATMYEPWTLHAARLGSHRCAPLRSPASVRISGADPRGPRPSWRLQVLDEHGEVALGLRAPWAPDLHALVVLLRPLAAVDPRLLADDVTRDLFREPPRRRAR